MEVYIITGADFITLFINKVLYPNAQKTVSCKIDNCHFL